jgi:hypothetical protein
MAKEKGLTFYDLMEFVFNPENGQGEICYTEFFQMTGNVTWVLNWWMSAAHKSTSAKQEVHEWAVGYVSDLVKDEVA